MLQKVVSDNNLRRIIAYKASQVEPSTIAAQNGTQFSFENGFITLFDGFNTRSHNLAFLKEYKIKDVNVVTITGNNNSTEKVLLLAFD